METATVYLTGSTRNTPEAELTVKYKTQKDKIPDKAVFMPVDQVWSKGLWTLTPENRMKARIQMMLNCDELHLLPCWNQDKESMLERDIALRVGMPIVHY